MPKNPNQFGNYYLRPTTQANDSASYIKYKRDKGPELTIVWATRPITGGWLHNLINTLMDDEEKIKTDILSGSHGGVDGNVTHNPSAREYSFYQEDLKTVARLKEKYSLVNIENYFKVHDFGKARDSDMHNEWLNNIIRDPACQRLVISWCLGAGTLDKIEILKEYKKSGGGSMILNDYN